MIILSLFCTPPKIACNMFSKSNLVESNIFRFLKRPALLSFLATMLTIFSFNSDLTFEPKNNEHLRNVLTLSE